MKKDWKKFIIAALVRALYTFAEAALAMIGTSVFIDQVNWVQVLSASALAAIISILKSIVVGMPEVDKV